MMKLAFESSHCLHPGPSCHERSSELHRLATRASLPMDALMASSAFLGTPFPIGLPAILVSNEWNCVLP